MCFPTLCLHLSAFNYYLLCLQVVCGQDHSLFRTELGEVYACGWGADGQTGLSDLFPNGLTELQEMMCLQLSALLNMTLQNYSQISVTNFNCTDVLYTKTREIQLSNASSC